LVPFLELSLAREGDGDFDLALIVLGGSGYHFEVGEAGVVDRDWLCVGAWLCLGLGLRWAHDDINSNYQLIIT
jgi:hypothetical protein